MGSKITLTLEVRPAVSMEGASEATKIELDCQDIDGFSMDDAVRKLAKVLKQRLSGPDEPEDGSMPEGAVRSLSWARLEHEDEERAFFNAWVKKNASSYPGHTTLAWLLCPQANDRKSPHFGKPEEPSTRDKVVAMTVVQWMGSAMGQAFLRSLGYEKKPTS